MSTEHRQPYPLPQTHLRPSAQPTIARTSTTSVVIIDAHVKEAQWLASQLSTRATVAILEGDRDGLTQITEILQTRPEAHRPVAVHIISHGAPGVLYLGNAELSLDNLYDYADVIRQWFAAAPAPSSLLLYGCKVAAGDVGKELIQRLHSITGVAIAASTTRTGHAFLGGDWHLHHHIGGEAAAVIVPQQVQVSYPGVLETVTVDNTDSAAIDITATSRSRVIRTFEVTADILVDAVSLGFNASHTYRGDIQVVLQSPSGTRVTIIASRSLDDADNYDVLFTDTATTALDDGDDDDPSAPLYDRLAQPSSPLEAFVGESALGTWTLEFYDVLPTQDDGVYNSSRLIIEGSPPAGFTVTPTGVSTTVGEAGTTDTVSVVLDRQPTGNVVIDVAAGDTGEATVTPTRLTFTPANWNTPQTVTITGVNDSLPDGNQTSSVTFTVDAAASANEYDAVDSQSVSVVTVDDDTVGFTVTQTNGNTQVTEAGSTDSFTVVLTAQPLTDVVIDVSNSDTGEASTSPTQLTFTAANWNTPQTVTVTGVDDASVDGTQFSTLTLSIDPDATDDDFDAIASQTVIVTTTDDDTVGFTVTPTSLSVSESGTTQTFSVVLDAQPTSDVVITVSSGDSGEATVNQTSLTFTAANWD
ncbi:MAG: DUF4347 domain-containing protein, partial [Synechococcales bacterium]|nr:DUF4347 domain-containing protein [Synechococcales bacterium]